MWKWRLPFPCRITVTQVGTVTAVVNVMADITADQGLRAKRPLRGGRLESATGTTIHGKQLRIEADTSAQNAPV